VKPAVTLTEPMPGYGVLLEAVTRSCHITWLTTLGFLSVIVSIANYNRLPSISWTVYHHCCMCNAPTRLLNLGSEQRQLLVDPDLPTYAPVTLPKHNKLASILSLRFRVQTQNLYRRFIPC